MTMKTFFVKLQQYIGSNLTKLIDRKDEPHTFRFMNDRVYYLSEAHLKLASNVEGSLDSTARALENLRREASFAYISPAWTTSLSMPSTKCG